jgi:hypothetical protein
MSNVSIHYPVKIRIFGDNIPTQRNRTVSFGVVYGKKLNNTTQNMI